MDFIADCMPKRAMWMIRGMALMITKIVIERLETQKSIIRFILISFCAVTYVDRTFTPLIIDIRRRWLSRTRRTVLVQYSNNNTFSGNAENVICSEIVAQWAIQKFVAIAALLKM